MTELKVLSESVKLKDDITTVMIEAGIPRSDVKDILDRITKCNITHYKLGIDTVKLPSGLPTNKQEQA